MFLVSRLTMQRLATLCVLLLVGKAAADLYVHNPRGSNDRLDDNNRDRDNGNRVFDSQNNNRGGYNVGELGLVLVGDRAEPVVAGNLYYFAGSVLPMEFTVQHTCGNPNNQCELIIQAMCDPKLRDGTTSNVSELIIPAFHFFSARFSPRCLT